MRAMIHPALPPMISMILVIVQLRLVSWCSVIFLTSTWNRTKQGPVKEVLIHWLKLELPMFLSWYS